MGALWHYIGRSGVACMTATLRSQPKAIQTLSKLVAEQRAHAVLLSGPLCSGPFEAALLVARRLLCPQDGCDDCNTCRRVNRRVHPDLLWIEPEGSNLRKEQIQEANLMVTKMPFEGRAQVVVIEGADSLSSDNASAGNILLKSLEEPAGRVMFVLLATHSGRILPTISSRCIEIPFPRITDAMMMKVLQEEGIDETQLLSATGLNFAQLARISRGNLGNALQIISGEAFVGRRIEMHSAMHRVASGQQLPRSLATAILSRITAASEQATNAAAHDFDQLELTMDDAEKRRFNSKSNPDGRDKRTARRARKARSIELQDCLLELLHWWRDVLAVYTGSISSVTNVDRIEQLHDVANSPAGPHAIAAIDAIDSAALRLRINNADEPVLIGALCAELASAGLRKTRAVRTLSGGALTPTGYNLVLS